MKILWTKGASCNLDEIEEYIAKDNPGAAARTVLTIVRSVEQLIDQPAMGRVGRIDGTRELVIPGLPYIVPYRVKKQNIEVLRFFHTSRRWPQ